MNEAKQLTFSEQVYSAVRKIPKGKVATYGQIAMLIGHPGASRAVGTALHHNPDNSVTPCHRVVNAKGRLAREFAFSGAEEQKFLLEREGVEVLPVDADATAYRVDLAVYGIKIEVCGTAKKESPEPT